MLTITSGTEKQNAWANSIIRKPVESVLRHLERVDEAIAAGCEQDGVVIAPLKAAIELYEGQLDAVADQITARYAIDNRDNFQRLMWAAIKHTFKLAGLNCDSPCMFMD